MLCGDFRLSSRPKWRDRGASAARGYRFGELARKCQSSFAQLLNLGGGLREPWLRREDAPRSLPRSTSLRASAGFARPRLTRQPPVGMTEWAVSSKSGYAAGERARRRATDSQGEDQADRVAEPRVEG